MMLNAAESRDGHLSFVCRELPCIESEVIEVIVVYE